jgi:hypothetical protein
MDEIIPENKIIRFDDLWGKIEVRTTPPDYVPRKLQEQIVLVSGTPSSLYVYSYASNTWKQFGSSDSL